MFFNISPKEVEAIIDLTQQVMLKVMYEATELAGYSLQQHIGEKVTVFARLMTAGFDTRSLGDEFDTSASTTPSAMRARCCRIASRTSTWRALP